MDPAEFRRAGHQLVDWISRYLENPEQYPVLSRVRPGDCRDALPTAAPASGEEWDQIFADVDRLIEDRTITGGMVPKIRSAVDALQAGTNKVHLVDGRIQHSLLLEIFTDEGVGTQIVKT